MITTTDNTMRIEGKASETMELMQILSGYYGPEAKIKYVIAEESKKIQEAK